MKRRVLLTLLTGRKRDIDHVRRCVGYDELVLVDDGTGRRLAESIHATESRIGPCCIQNLGEDDVTKHMESLRHIIETHGGMKIILNAAGGSHALSTAMMLVAYERGLDLRFVQEDRSTRLPVFSGITFHDRLQPIDKHVLSALPARGGFAYSLAETMERSLSRVEASYRRLADQGILRLEARKGRLWGTPDNRTAVL